MQEAPSPPLAHEPQHPANNDEKRRGRPRSPSKRKRKGRDKRKRRESACCKHGQYVEAGDAWYFARTIGCPINMSVTIRRAGIDAYAPAERQAIYQRYRAKLDQYCRDRKFPLIALWSREAARGTGLGEHLHVLMFAPAEEQAQFRRVVGAWLPGKLEIHIRVSDYQNRMVWDRASRSWRITNACIYAFKNSPWTVWGASNDAHRLGGPVFGKRCGLTRNINAKAMAMWRSTRRLDGTIARYLASRPAAQSAAA